MTPAEELRAAAERIRDLAVKATPGPWELYRSDGGKRAVNEVNAVEGGAVIAVVCGYADARAGKGDHLLDGDAAHIAAWSPPVVLAVAAWLEQTAERHDDNDGECWICVDERFPCPDMAAALAVARAFMGGAA